MKSSDDAQSPNEGAEPQSGGEAETTTKEKFQMSSLEDIQNLLLRQNGVALGPDDPMAMLVSLHRAFGSDYQRLLTHHDQTIRQLLRETGAACADAVALALNGLKDKTVQASLDRAFTVVRDQERALTEHRASMRRNTWLLVFLSVVNALAVSVSLAALYGVLK